MNEETKDAWISLTAHYRIDPAAHHADLFNDSTIWLDSAHGIAQTLSEAMCQVNFVSTDHLASALFGVATLIDMGRRCSEQAHTRMLLELRVLDSQSLY
ncbi:MAG: hypothetical protein WA777_17655 [Rhodanobacter sp.]